MPYMQLDLGETVEKPGKWEGWDGKGCPLHQTSQGMGGAGNTHKMAQKALNEQEKL